MMRFPSTKLLFAGLFAAFLIPQTAHAQRTITLDNEDCVLGLEALGTLIGASVTTSVRPRNFSGFCKAEAVRVSVADNGVTLKFKVLQWGTGDFTTLASGKIPAEIFLSIYGARVTSVPNQDPVWTVLAAQPDGMNVELIVNFSSSEKKLHIARALVDFNNGNTVEISVILSNVSSLLTENPLFGMVAYVLNDVTLIVTSGLTILNPVWDILQTELGGEAREDVAEAAARALGPVLNIRDMNALHALINDLPSPTGYTRLDVIFPTEYPLLRLALIRRVRDLGTTFYGADIDLSYHPKAR